MFTVKCSVCDTGLELKDDTKVGDRFTCTNCFAQLVLRIDQGQKVARCALCLKGNEALECDENCERVIDYEKKRGFPFPES